MLFSGPSIRESKKEDRVLLGTIHNLLSNVIETAGRTLSDKVLDNFVFNCHSVCRALQEVLGKDRVTVVDGQYLGINITPEGKEKIEFQMHDHSWLVTPTGAIIDPYPTGIIGIISLCPLLVVNSGPYRVYGGSRYIPCPDVTKRVGTRETWRKSQLLAKVIRQSQNRTLQGE
jgi:hypothetical protein